MASRFGCRNRAFEAVAGGNPPDIAIESYGWPITYSQMGILQPVDDVIEAIGEENILPQDLKLNYYDGHYWGVPLYGTPSVLTTGRMCSRKRG